MRKSNEKSSLDKNTEHNHRATLFGLPTEILLKIFRYVPGADAASAGRACKASYAIAHTSPVKEKIQLERAARTIQVAADSENTFIWRNFPGSCVLFGVGKNVDGKLGTGDTLARETFTQVQLPRRFVRIIQVATSFCHTVIYGADAKGNPLIATCGWNDAGQLGIGTVTFMSVVFSTIQLPQNFVRVSQVAAIGTHTIVSGIDVVGNSIFSGSGWNDYGFLGIGGRKCPKTLTVAQFPVKLIDVLQVGAGANHTLISGVNDKDRPLLIACGHNSCGELGTGDTQGREMFTQVQLPPDFVSINQVIAADGYSIVLGEDAEDRPLLASCGNNYHGQLGTGDNLNRNTLTLLNLPETFVRVSQVVVGDRATAVVGADFKGRPLLAVSGLNCFHQFGVADYQDGKNTFAFVDLPLALVRVDQIVVGNESSFICGADAEGAPLLAATGANHFGQLGTGNNERKSTYTLVKLPKSFSKVIHVDANRNLALVYGMDAEGAPLLATCGRILHRQLGVDDYDYEDRNRFVLVSLPECLQPKFHPLPENEHEQFDDNLSLEEVDNESGCTTCSIS